MDARQLQPHEVIDQAWDYNTGRATQPWPHIKRAYMPQDARDAVHWMHQCPDYEEWVLQRLQHWKQKNGP